MVQRELPMHDEAQQTLDRCLEIREEVYGPDHILTGWSLFHLAWLAQSRARARG